MVRGPRGGRWRGSVASDVLDSALAAPPATQTDSGGVRWRLGDPEIFRFAERAAALRGDVDLTSPPSEGGAERRLDHPPPPRPYPTSDDESAAAAATDAWDGLRRAVDPWSSSALLRSGLMVENDGTGATFGVTAVECVTSLPSAPEQHFHADGRERGIVNVFVPLVDVPASMGPTHFRRGSHAWDHDSPYLTREQRRAQEGAEDVVPEAEARVRIDIVRLQGVPPGRPLTRRANGGRWRTSCTRATGRRTRGTFRMSRCGTRTAPAPDEPVYERRV